MKLTRGFTLVEILIVVIILGILAAIVVPQFTEASSDAKLSALMTDLQAVRNQISLYKAQHGFALPSKDIVDELTNRTDADGTVNNSNGSYGPYLNKFPTNPFAGNNDVNVDGTKGSGTAGWYYNTTTGEFSPNTSDHSDL